MLAETCETVHLMTYDRLSFIGARDYTLDNYRRLCRIYGENRFRRHVVNIERLHKSVCYADYFKMAKRFRLSVVALTFSKLAMHWFSLSYALQNGIQIVADGAVPYMHLYPDQNREICLKPLGELYRRHGIEYRNPVYEISGEVEQRLYDRGLSDAPLTRGTEKDRQVFYAEQVILAMFIKYYTSTHGPEAYVGSLKELYADRLKMIESRLREAGHV